MMSVRPLVPMSTVHLSTRHLSTCYMQFSDQGILLLLQLEKNKNEKDSFIEFPGICRIHTSLCNKPKKPIHNSRIFLIRIVALSLQRAAIPILSSNPDTN